MKKVKDWLDSNKKQFIVLETNHVGDIILVQRISDGAKLSVGPQVCVVYFFIMEFDEDLIHAKVYFEDDNRPGVFNILKCQIDHLELSKSGEGIISWEGITEDGMSEMSVTPYDEFEF